MPARKFRACPCAEHKNAFVPGETYRRHIQEITRGVRQRWNGTEELEEDAATASAAPASLQQNTAIDENDFETCLQFAHEILELVAQNLLSITGAEAVLKITHKNYQELLPDGFKIPPTWYMCKKFAMDGDEPIYFTRDFCPKCDYLYSAKSKRTYCPICPAKEYRYNEKGGAVYAILFLSLISYV